jgi:hypothetical protein
MTPLPLRCPAAHLPHEATQLGELSLQVLGHVLLPLNDLLLALHLVDQHRN